MNCKKILIVENDSQIVAELEEILTESCYTVVSHVSSEESALMMSEQISVDLILMNILLNGPVDGITTTDKILQKRDIPIIYLSEYSEEELSGRISKTASYGYLRKPIDKRELIATIQMAFSRYDKDRLIRAKEAQYWVFIHDNLLPVVTENPLIQTDRLSDSWMLEQGEWMAS